MTGVLIPDSARGALPVAYLLGVGEGELPGIAQAMHRRAVLAAVPVEDWNAELSPWPAPGLRAGEEFAGRAADTLARLTAHAADAEMQLAGEGITPGVRLLCGYSLAGLCALWTATMCGLFDGVGSMSGSLWYEGWQEHLAAHAPQVRSVYLSLGDREPRARNQRLARVGSGTQATYDLLRGMGLSACFEWNTGNHFADFDLRMARGLDWLCGICK